MRKVDLEPVNPRAWRPLCPGPVREDVCTQPDVNLAFQTGSLEPASRESAGTGDAAALNKKG